MKVNICLAIILSLSTVAICQRDAPCPYKVLGFSNPTLQAAYAKYPDILAEVAVIRQNISYKGFCNTCRMNIHYAPICTKKACALDLMSMDNAVVDAAINYLATGDFEGSAYCELDSIQDNSGGVVKLLPKYPNRQVNY